MNESWYFRTLTLTPSSRISPISQELGVTTLELSIPYRMDESCNFRTLTLTPFSKISVMSQESRVMTLDSSIPYCRATPDSDLVHGIWNFGSSFDSLTNWGSSSVSFPFSISIGRNSSPYYKKASNSTAATSPTFTASWLDSAIRKARPKEQNAKRIHTGSCRIWDFA